MTSRALLDANVLIAATVSDHEHHEAARSWLGDSRPFATCPSTQGSLIRYLVRVASPQHALDAIEALGRVPHHRFIPDEIPYGRSQLEGVIGHRQVTDAYLASLARHHCMRVATFDRGFKTLRPDDVDLIG